MLTVPARVCLIGREPGTEYRLLPVCGGFHGAGGLLPSRLVSLRTAIVFLIPSLLALFTVRKVLMPAIPHELLSMGRLIVTQDLLGPSRC